MRQHACRFVGGIVIGILFSGTAQAGFVDLVNTTSGSINDALFFRSDFNPGGTGTLNSFLRLQHDNGPSNNGHSDNGREQGYNTSGRPVQYDENTDPNFTRDLLFGEIPIVTIASVDYKEFVLDINEPQGGTQSLLSLDQVNIYTSDVGSQTGVESTLGTLRYTTGGSLNENTVLLDSGFSSGSGEGDMRMYVPLSNFSGVDDSDFVYLYSHFGNLDSDHRTGSGFEEWSVLTVIPEPGSLALIGAAGVLTMRRRRRT